MSDLTEAQVNFIDWLGEGSGECVMDRYGRGFYPKVQAARSKLGRVA